MGWRQVSILSLVFLFGGCTGSEPSFRRDLGPTPDVAALDPPPDMRLPEIRPDAGPLPYLIVVGTHNNWELADPASILLNQDGVFEGEIELPIGPWTFKFALDGTWETNFGGIDERLELPREGEVVENGPNLRAEVPLQGRWRIRVDLRTHHFSATLAEPTPAQTIALNILAGSLPPAGALVFGEDVLFVTDEPAAVAGSFNEWAIDDVLIPNSAGIYYRAHSLGPAVGHTYKFTHAGRWWRDQGQKHVAWDGISVAGVGAFNSVVYTEGYRHQLGHLEWFESASPQLGDVRDVFVYLPAEPADELPWILVHDGNESLTRSHFNQALDTAIEAGDVPQMAAVFVALPTQNVRLAQYTFGEPEALGDAYVAYLVDTLLPDVEQRYGLSDDRAKRGIIGASLGGLISFYAAWQHPEIWRIVGGQSSSFFWNDRWIINAIRAAPRRDYVIYIDSGEPNDNADVTREMAAVLAEKGYDFTHIEEPGGQHEWRFWDARFGAALNALF